MAEVISGPFEAVEEVDGLEMFAGTQKLRADAVVVKFAVLSFCDAVNKVGEE